MICLASMLRHDNQHGQSDHFCLQTPKHVQIGKDNKFFK